MRKRNLRVTIAGTEGCEILPELQRNPSDTIIVKKRYSAFFGTELDAILRALRPPSLVIDAYQRDYEVIVVSDGIASYDVEHHEITKRYLEGTIARFLPSAEIVKRLSSNNDTA